MNSLYDIKNRFVELANSDELTDDEKNELGTILAQELTTKSANIIGFVRNVETGIEAINSETARLTAMKDSASNKLDRFKDYVKQNMTELSLEKIETPIGTIKIQKNPMSVEIVNEDEIPKEFMKTKVTVSADKTAIKNTYKENGELVPGTRIITNNTSLRIV